MTVSTLLLIIDSFTYVFLYYSILVRYIFTFIISESMFSFNSFILDVLVYYNTYDRYVYV